MKAKWIANKFCKHCKFNLLGYIYTTEAGRKVLISWCRKCDELRKG